MVASVRNERGAGMRAGATRTLLGTEFFHVVWDLLHAAIVVRCFQWRAVDSHVPLAGDRQRA